MTQLMRQRFLLRASMLAMIAAVGIAGAQPARAADEVTQERLLNADKEPGNWIHHHKNFSGTRFSTLKDINRDTVKNLKVAWTMQLSGVDGRLVATNKETGQVTWQRQVANPDKGEVITGAPLIVKNMAITGVAGAEYGIRGWVAATDLSTQKELWRTYTIPAKDEPGHETWKDEVNAAASGGGSTWVTGSYDQATDTIVWGVGNPGPDWDDEYRPGDNLYTDSSLALDATTGKIKWHYQHTPNDPYDYDLSLIHISEP